MTRHGIWRTLGLDRTTDSGAIRRAYGQALRAMDPDADPAGFAQLRQARDQALAQARGADRTTSGPPDDRGRETWDHSVPIPATISLTTPVAESPDATGTISAAALDDPERPFRLESGHTDSGDGAAIPIDLDRVTLAAPVLAGTVGGDVLASARSDNDRFDDMYRDVLALLYASDATENQWLSDADDARLVALVETLLADPRLEQIAFSADAERWFGDTLAGAIPRSDPVLPRIAERFGWLRQAGHIAQSPAAARIAERVRSLAFVAEVQRPAHPDHRIWRELTKPAVERSRRSPWIVKRSVKRFLETVRRDYPDAEGYFDTYRVSLWENSVSGPGWRGWGFGIFLLLQVISHFVPDYSGRDVNAPQTPLMTLPSTALTNRDTDINRALLSLADVISVDQVKTENSELYAMLTQRWDEANHVKTPINAYLVETRAFLIERFEAALPRTDYDSAAKWQRFNLAELDRVRTRGDKICAEYLAGTLDSATFNTEADAIERRRMIAAIVLGDHGSARAVRADHRFTVPGSVVETIRDDTHLSQPDVARALAGKGSAHARCAVRRALIASALALPPKTGLKLLRAM